jgi:hypothetical protein
MHSIKFDIGRGPRSGRTGIVGVLGLHATGVLRKAYGRVRNPRDRR